MKDLKKIFFSVLFVFTFLFSENLFALNRVKKKPEVKIKQKQILKRLKQANKENKNILVFLAEKEEWKFLSFFLKKEVFFNIDPFNVDSFNLLHYVCGKKNVGWEIVNILLERARPEKIKEFKDSSGFNALHIACMQNVNIKIIRSLIAAGINVNTSTNDNSTPLKLAIEFNASLELIQVLLEKGAAFKNISEELIAEYKNSDKLKELFEMYEN